MTHNEAQRLQIEGRYSELLRAAVKEQVESAQGLRAEDELRWTLWAAKACRYIGRTFEGMAHAAHAVMRAQAISRQDLLAEAIYTQALLFKGAHRSADAIETLDRALAALPAFASDLTRCVFELERAELALDARRPEDARASLARGAARAHSLENPRLLAWTLYLRAQIDDPGNAAGQLAAAYEIAQSMHCPELEWQILWRFAVVMGENGQPMAETDYAHRAIGILRTESELIREEDRDSFWRQGAREAFLEYGRRRFGDDFPKQAASKLAAPALTDVVDWDPALLPEFVHASFERSLKAAF